jgi:hypothetical protein
MEGVEFVKSQDDDNIINIIYDGRVYGNWDHDANIRYPEDLTLDEDLSELISIGIEIGKQMLRNEQNEFK